MKKRFKLYNDDNIKALKSMPPNSIDSIVTDPPYALTPSKGAKAGFMGKLWDAEVPSVELWKEVYRVLKPGGHVLSFGGTRTYHRMVVNIEDAGFEIRDQIQWIYSTGFPKSHNIGKAVDKIQGNEREVVGKYIAPDGKVRKGVNKDIMPNATEWDNEDRIQTKGASQYEGFGTALKPAVEPICVARKPLSESTIVANVLKWGTGGINIDGCRIGTELISHGTSKADIRGKLGDAHTRPSVVVEDHITEGRFPANIIFDESAAEMLDEQSGISKSNTKARVVDNKEANILKEHKWDHKEYVGDYSDKGGASRFFYIAKVSKSERNMGLDGFEEKEFKGRDELANGKQDEPFKKRPGSMKNTHPTLKPVQLMAYLCRLVTPPNGIVLDPFMGSGSTGISACLEGFRFVGMEMNEEYFTIASARIEAYEKYRPFVEKKKKKK